MVIIQHNGIKYECTMAIRGSNFVHLLDKGCCMLAQFNNVTDFNDFVIEAGNWTVANTAYEYYAKTLGSSCNSLSGKEVSWDTSLFKYLQNFVGGSGGSGGGIYGFYTLEVDDEGNLWANYPDTDAPPPFEFDQETGNLYIEV